MTESLAHGAPLTAETFDDFVSRLRYDVVGDGVKRHYTADAIFRVEQKTRVYGISEDYGGTSCIYLDDVVWNSIESFWGDASEEDRELLDDMATKEWDCKFLSLRSMFQWELLENFKDYIVSSYVEEWVHVNSHLTYDAAEAFIKRKQHDYNELRIYVDSNYWCWEFKSIINGILSGKLKYVE